jgi:hypothetical protein
MTLQEAAYRARKSENTIRNWCEREGLGRRIGGKWCVSKVALEMYLDGESRALDRYLQGDRASDDIVAYFGKFRLPVLRPVTAT